MKLLEFDDTISELEFIDQNKVYIIPVRITGTVVVFASHPPTEAIVELNGQTIFDQQSDVTFAALGDDEFEVQIDVHGSVTLFQDNFQSAEKAVRSMTPYFWCPAAFGPIDNRLVQVTGSVTCVDLSQSRVVTLCRVEGEVNAS